jgi:hypothetical protein
MDEERVAAKESPEWFLLLARAWLTVARTAVPWGTVTNVVGCVALFEATLLETGFAEAVAAFGAGALAATTLPMSGFLAAGLGAAGLLGGFATTAFLGGVAGV